MSSKESFTQISPSEFFYRNRDLAGFSNPTRSLYTAVREFVENSLDACDQKGILADVHMSIKAVDAEKQDPKISKTRFLINIKNKIKTTGERSIEPKVGKKRLILFNAGSVNL